MTDKYILKGHEAIPTDSLMEWGKMMENQNRIVKQETLPNGKFVSTVFLGIDHQFGNGPPLIFETMVFDNGRSGRDEDMERYTTWEQAEEGHKRMVEKWTTNNG